MAAASAESAGGTGDGERGERTTPLRVDAQRNLEHVLRAAREVFGELGYGAPMEDVARRARVGVGTVYRRFPSKDVLVRRIAAEETERLADQARAALSQEDDPWGALTRFLRYAVSTGAGRLLPPEVLRAGAEQVTAVSAASKLPQQRQDSPAAVPDDVVAAAVQDAVPDTPGGAPVQRESAPQDGAAAVEAPVAGADPVAPGAPRAPGAPVRLMAEDVATAGLLDAVGGLVERASLVGGLRSDVSVADVLLVIATAAPSLPDAAQQAAASARVLEILLDGLRAQPVDSGRAAVAADTAVAAAVDTAVAAAVDTAVAAAVDTAVDTAQAPVVTHSVEPSPFE